MKIVHHYHHLSSIIYHLTHYILCLLYCSYIATANCTCERKQHIQYNIYRFYQPNLISYFYLALLQPKPIKQRTDQPSKKPSKEPSQKPTARPTAPPTVSNNYHIIYRLYQPNIIDIYISISLSFSQNQQNSQLINLRRGQVNNLHRSRQLVQRYVPSLDKRRDHSSLLIHAISQYPLSSLFQSPPTPLPTVRL